ncbi:hypothetical protein [Haloarcula brevis]|uniref:hypothetical protein n=1 Tax=Haloarcula brevis TaxID=3111453 RepID=UPI00300F5251
MSEDEMQAGETTESENEAEEKLQSERTKAPCVVCGTRTRRRVDGTPLCSSSCVPKNKRGMLFRQYSSLPNGVKKLPVMVMIGIVSIIVLGTIANTSLAVNAGLTVAAFYILQLIRSPYSVTDVGTYNRTDSVTKTLWVDKCVICDTKTTDGVERVATTDLVIFGAHLIWSVDARNYYCMEHAKETGTDAV